VAEGVVGWASSIIKFRKFRKFRKFSHAHGMGLWAGGALAWGGPPRTVGSDASPAMRPIRGSPAALIKAGSSWLGPNFAGLRRLSL
jgi:hypothetical protein